MHMKMLVHVGANPVNTRQSDLKRTFGQFAKVVQVFHYIIHFLLTCIVREKFENFNYGLIYFSTILLYVLVFLFFLLFTFFLCSFGFSIFAIPLYPCYRLIVLFLSNFYRVKSLSLSMFYILLHVKYKHFILICFHASLIFYAIIIMYSTSIGPRISTIPCYSFYWLCFKEIKT